MTAPCRPVALLLRRPLAALCLLIGLGIQAQAAPVDVHGVKFEDRADVRGTPLVLNGAGTRFKAVFKVYAMALYVGRKTSTPEEVAAQPGPKRIVITMLRDIDANELGRLFTRGVEDNTPRSELSRLIPGLLRMGEMFALQKKLATGDTFSVDWIPGTGAIVTVRGQVQGEPFKEPEFFAALLRIWLGNNPADWRLKDQLLGKPV